MLNEKQQRFDCGVIVGRFQVDQLHTQHKELIDTVRDRCPRVVVVLGLSHVPNSTRNPIDYRSRRAMLQAEYPDIEVLFIKDQRSDLFWSRSLDTMVADIATPGTSVGLYGSRDSFIKHYKGKYPTVALEAHTFISGTQMRDQIKRTVKNSPEFRAGQVYAANGRYPTSFQTTDIVVYDPKKDRVLLGRKQGEDYHRFFGGFVDPRDESLEAAAARELREEAGTNVEIGGHDSLIYIGSHRVDDWRYRSESDKICTALFVAPYQYGVPAPGDDIAEVSWFDWGGVGEMLMPEHYVIWEKFRTRLTALRDTLLSQRGGEKI